MLTLVIGDKQLSSWSLRPWILLRHLDLPFWKISQMIHIYPTYTDVVRQPAKRYYIDRLRNNPVVKLASRLLGGRKP